MKCEIIPLAVFHVCDQAAVGFGALGFVSGKGLCIRQQCRDARHLRALAFAHLVLLLGARELGAQHDGADDKDGGHRSQHSDGYQAMAHQAPFPGERGRARELPALVGLGGGPGGAAFSSHSGQAGSRGGILLED